MNSWSDRVSAPPPTEAETIAEKSAGGRGLNVHLPHDVIGALQATARAEKRSVSNLAKAIVAEGLARRRGSHRSIPAKSTSRNPNNSFSIT